MPDNEAASNIWSLHEGPSRHRKYTFYSYMMSVSKNIIDIKLRIQKNVKDRIVTIGIFYIYYLCTFCYQAHEVKLSVAW